VSEVLEIRLNRVEAQLAQLVRLMEGPSLISKREAARRLGISPQTFDRRYVITRKLLLVRGKVRRKDLEDLT